MTFGFFFFFTLFFTHERSSFSIARFIQQGPLYYFDMTMTGSGTQRTFPVLYCVLLAILCLPSLESVTFDFVGSHPCTYTTARGGGAYNNGIQKITCEPSCVGPTCASVRKTSYVYQLSALSSQLSALSSQPQLSALSSSFFIIFFLHFNELQICLAVLTIPQQNEWL